jgi:hypothetical protein
MEQNEKSATADEVVEEKKEDKEKTHVKILCSMFFDGTLNSRDNVNTKKSNPALNKEMVKKGSESYGNDLSNVAKMEQYIKKESSEFDHVFSIYTEGPGTEALQVIDVGDSPRTQQKKKKNDGHRKDDSYGYAVGMGDTGVKAKVTSGISKLVSEIAKEVKTKMIIDKLVIDVFGFSRGAAGARFFVHEVLNEEPSGFEVKGTRIRFEGNALFARLHRNSYEITADKVEIRFVGLYDTVASCGIGDNYFEHGTRILKLDHLKHPAVKNVVHLASADEHRANFSLTSIASAGGKGKEIFLPGVHSDIGGGYAEHSPENFVINSSDSRQVLAQDRQALIAQGWYDPEQLTFENPNQVADFFGFDSKLRARRNDISNKYSTIPLNIMADFAKEQGLELEPDFSRFCKVTKAVETFHGPLKDYANKGASTAADWFEKTTPSWLPDLRHKHFHFSANYTRAVKVIVPNKPRIDNNKRIRHVYPG